MKTISIKNNGLTTAVSFFMCFQISIPSFLSLGSFDSSENVRNKFFDLWFSWIVFDSLGVG